MVYKKILGIVPGLQATALVGENLKLCPGYKIRSQGTGRGLGVGKGKGPIGRNMVRTGVTNFLGIGLIGATAKVINELP